MEELVRSGMIYDVIAVVILAVTALIYYKQGFLASVLGLGGKLVSVVGANILSKRLAAPLFEKIFAGELTQRIADGIAKGETELMAVLEQYAGFLPKSIMNTIVDAVSGITQSGAPELAHKVVVETIQPLMEPIFGMGIFFVTFLVIQLLVGVCVNLLKAANKIPLVGGANRTLGLVLGLAAGVVNLFLFLCALWAISTITNNGLSWLNSDTLAGSALYGLFAKLNPLM